MMQRLIAFVSFLLSVLYVAHTDARTEKLIFHDDFDNLDTTLWKHELTAGGGGNWEFQVYTNSRKNSYVKEGVLYIQPTLTTDDIGSLTSGALDMNIGFDPPSVCTSAAFYGCRRDGTATNILNPITSARLRSWESFWVKYGRVEVKAKLPEGDWIWPAIWMLPAGYQYGTWPTSGEIDIMESRGNVNYPALSDGQRGPQSFGSTLHFGPRYDYNAYDKAHNSFVLNNGSKLSDNFHVYGLYWDELGLYTYIDSPQNKVLYINATESGKSMWDLVKEMYPNAENTFTNPWANKTKMAPFDQEFYLIFNVAVGGTGGYFPEGVGNKPWSNTSPTAAKDFWDARATWQPTWVQGKTALAIDSVKVWSFDDSSTVYKNPQVTAFRGDVSSQATNPDNTNNGGSGSNNTDNTTATGSNGLAIAAIVVGSLGFVVGIAGLALAIAARK